MVLALAMSVSDLLGQVRAAETSYYAALPRAAKDGGSPQVYDYYKRLYDDESLLNSLSGPVPSGYTAVQFRDYAVDVARMDLDVVHQLMERKYTSITTAPGLREVFLKSSLDGTMQPSALYVPPSVKTKASVPVVVFLHGSGQSEADFMAPFYMRQLADSTGSVIIAPYGRENTDFRNGAVTDVYDALAAVRKTFNVDPRRIYLAGYSMGGFSVFEIAPLHPEMWSSVMCISGGILNQDADRVSATMRQLPTYVITGRNDGVVDSAYTTASAGYLASFNDRVSFYPVDNGNHRLVTLLPLLGQAWADMHVGTVRQVPSAFARYELPHAPAFLGREKP